MASKRNRPVNPDAQRVALYARVSTDGQTVRVLTTDYVTVQGLIYVDVDVHDGDDD